MSLLETIKVKNRQLQNIDWHNLRLNYSRQILFGATTAWDLTQMIEIPNTLSNGVYKCRVTYDEQLQKVEFEVYPPKAIQTLKICHSNTIDYAFKYANRNALTDLFQQKANCDDVLIVKNGWVTDTSYCNIAFGDGQKWFTPQNPLLKGTHRAFLLHQGTIQTKNIHINDLRRFQYFKVFNAMMHWEEQPSQAIGQIF
jgi:4-amino-4-deoxychorismate lyase